MASTSFRFLDLPKELRLMVYERIPIETRHHVLRDYTFRNPDLHPSGTPEQKQAWLATSDPAKISTITLVTKSLTILGIALTCRLVHDEVKACVAHKLANLRAEPLRLIVDSPSLFVTTNCRRLHGLFHYIVAGLKCTPSVPSWPKDEISLDCDQSLTPSRGSQVSFEKGSIEYAAIAAFVSHCTDYIRKRGSRSMHLCATQHVCQHPGIALRNFKVSFEGFHALKGSLGFWSMGVNEFRWLARGFGDEDEIEATLLDADPYLNDYDRAFFVTGVSDQDWAEDWEEGQWIEKRRIRKREEALKWQG